MVYIQKLGAPDLVKPLDSKLYSADFAKEFNANFKLIGTESVSFSCPLPENPSDLSLGKIYFCYMDKAKTYQLPSTFILTDIKLAAPSINPDAFYYQCEGIGINDLLYRTFLNIDRKNISFRKLMIEIIEQTRLKVPQISNDYSEIEDIDFNISSIRETSRYAGEVFEDFRNNLGFEIYLRPDLKLHASKTAQASEWIVDLGLNKLNDQRVINEGWECGYVNPIAPTTSLIAIGGLSESGNETTESLTGTGSPVTGNKLELSSNVNIEDNFLLEPFESTIINNASGQSITGNGWDRRYQIYDLPVEIKQGFETQIKFEVSSSTGQTYLSGVNDGDNLNPSGTKIGFFVNGESLGLLVNGLIVATGVTLKPFESRNVAALSADRKTLTVDSLTGSTLVIGDTVQVSGLSTAAAINAKIVNILGLKIVLDIPVTEGSLAGLKLVRKTQYVARWVMSGDNNAQFFIKIGNAEFVDLGSYSIALPFNPFLTIFNNFDSPTLETVSNGVWSIGNVDLDYWFVDFYKFVKVRKNGKKIITVPTDFAETVFAEAEIETVTKNNVEVAEVNFFVPSLLRTITQTSTTTRLFLVLNSTDFLTTGMRILVNGLERFVASFVINSTNPLQSYINLTQALPTAPVVDTPVYINTSTPAAGDLVEVTYNQLKQLVVRECNETACFDQFGYKEATVSVPEITNLLDLVDRAQDVIRDGCTPKLQGNFGFVVSTNCDCEGTYKLAESLTPFIALPVVGSYLEVTYQPKDKNGLNVENIDRERVVIQDYSIQQNGDLNSAEGALLAVAINFGLPENTNYRLTTNLLKQFAVFRSADSEDINYNIPCILKDNVTITETLTVAESAGNPFVSGIYKINSSGSKEFIEPTETLTVTESAGNPFVSGRYFVNYSASA